MHESTARRIAVPSKAATMRHPTTKASTRPASQSGRPGRAAALREELEHIERDIREMTDDFAERVGPLTKAFAAAHRKLLKLDPPKKKR